MQVEHCKLNLFVIQLIFFFSLALSKIMARPRPWKKRHRHFEIETTRDSSRQFETIRDNNDNSGTNIVGQGTFLNLHFTL